MVKENIIITIIILFNLILTQMVMEFMIIIVWLGFVLLRSSRKVSFWETCLFKF